MGEVVPGYGVKPFNAFSATQHPPIIRNDTLPGGPPKYSTFTFSKKNSKHNLWVGKPSGMYTLEEGFIEAFTSDLYLALGPTDCAAKARVQLESDGKTPHKVMSKFLEDHENIEQQDCTLEQTHLIAHMVLMYVTEEADLNPGNLKKESNGSSKTRRIDFGWSWVDYTKTYSDTAAYFTGKSNISARNIFSIAQRDLEHFPNLVIAKPYNMLHYSKRDTATLIQMSERDEFNKIAHQYFLKALLFDENLINPIVNAHISDPKMNAEFSAHVRERFFKLKKSLMQTPRFRKNVLAHFDEYQKNILDEFAAYNERFARNFDSKAVEKQEQRADRVLELEDAKIKLKALYHTARLCEYVTQTDLNKPALESSQLQDDFKVAQKKIETALKVSLNLKSPFHQYAMQLALTLGAGFLEEELCAAIDEQIAIKIDHLTTLMYARYEHVLLLQLGYIKSFIKDKPPLERAGILFYVNVALDELLLEKEQNQVFAQDVIPDLAKKIPQYSEIANNIVDLNALYVNIKAQSYKSHSEVIATVNAQRNIRPFILYSVWIIGAELLQGSKIRHMVLRPDMEHQDVQGLLYQFAINEAKHRCDEILASLVKIQTTRSYSKLKTALEECIDYAESLFLDNRGQSATAFIDKMNTLCEILQSGITSKDTIANVVQKMQAEMAVPDAQLDQHVGGKGVMEEIMKSFSGIFSTASSSTVTPSLETKRKKKLDAVVTTFSALPQLN